MLKLLSKGKNGEQYSIYYSVCKFCKEGDPRKTGEW